MEIMGGVAWGLSRQTNRDQLVNNESGSQPVQSAEQIFQQLLVILDQLDRGGHKMPALHVCEALEAISPGDTRIPGADPFLSS